MYIYVCTLHKHTLLQMYSTITAPTLSSVIVVQMESSSVTVGEMEPLVEVCVLKVGQTVLPTTALLATRAGSAMGESHRDRVAVCMFSYQCCR